MRFCELQQAVGVNPRTLAQRLRFLRAECLIERGASEGTPRYALTVSGEHLVPVLDGLREWQSRWLASPSATYSTATRENARHREVGREQD
jgi:DNA-binding HxlR family transcriptional regulator